MHEQQRTHWRICPECLDEIDWACADCNCCSECCECEEEEDEDDEEDGTDLRCDGPDRG